MIVLSILSAKEVQNDKALSQNHKIVIWKSVLKERFQENEGQASKTSWEKENHGRLGGRKVFLGSLLLASLGFTLCLANPKIRKENGTTKNSLRGDQDKMSQRVPHRWQRSFIQKQRHKRGQ